MDFRWSDAPCCLREAGQGVEIGLAQGESLEVAAHLGIGGQALEGRCDGALLFGRGVSRQGGGPGLDAEGLQKGALGVGAVGTGTG